MPRKKTTEYTQEEKDLITRYRKGRMELLNFIAKDLFNAVTKEDVMIVLPNGTMKLQDQILDKEMVKNLATEAHTILMTRVWEEVSNEIEYEACRMMYQNSKTTDDLVFGKAALWVTDLYRRKIENLSKLVS